MSQARRIDELSENAGRQFRGLVIDDEPWVSGILQGFCELSSSITVDVCYNGLEAIKRLQSESYDFATVDLVMPELSGVETVKGILQVSPHLPIMIVTGNATDRLMSQAGCAGARKIMEKPVDATDFLTEIGDLLEMAVRTASE